MRPPMNEDVDPVYRRVNRLSQTPNLIVDLVRTALRPGKALHLRWYDRIIYGIGAIILAVVVLGLLYSAVTGRLHGP